MVGQLFTKDTVDEDGRYPVLDNTIVSVYHYFSANETWDKTGSGNQSWYLENYLPSDNFDDAEIQSDRWSEVNTPSGGDSTVSQSSGLLVAAVERDEGTVGISSDGKWRLVGDFEVRLYMDWGSYYNEYRSISHTFLKVGYDNENAVRVAFTFDGEGFALSSEISVDRSLVFFDWQDNGDVISVADIEAAQDFLYFKITREGGTLKTFLSDGETDTQVGDDITDAVFSENLFVELGVETKEYNTYRQSFDKFFVQGTVTPTTEFFSNSRGRKQEFPDSTIIAIETLSLSIIDEDTGKLWARLLFDEDGAVPDSTTKVSACDGVIYCTTSNGLVAFDFPNDRIYRYRSNNIEVSNEPMSLRNSSINFNTYISNIGNIPNNGFLGVGCGTVGGTNFVAATTASEVVVFKPLASGVAASTDGEYPGAGVKITDKGTLYWAGYDTDNNISELSYYSGLSSLASNVGSTTFSRTGYYGTDSSFPVLGIRINDFDALTVNGADLVAVATDEGITFIGNSPAVPFSGATSYGVISASVNPFTDPSFENYLGIDWDVKYSMLHNTMRVRRTSNFAPAGSYDVQLIIDDAPIGAFYEEDNYVGIYQQVDLTDIPTVYFDIHLETDGISPPGVNSWDFEVVVNDDIVKSYSDTDGPFTKYADNFDTTNYSGVCTVVFRKRIIADTGVTGIGNMLVYIDNIKTSIGSPDYPILPAGNASVKEVLIQYDSVGRKIYFASQGGYGAIDIDDNSLDYFQPLEGFLPGEDIQSADFSRSEDEL